MFDVIIVGASFAGLAVASQLRGHRVLLVDRKPMGSGQTSAYGTLLSTLQHWDLSETIVQTHEALVLHTAGREFRNSSPYLWCTFDYRSLCELMFARTGAEFVLAAAQGVESGQVQTSKGLFEARCVVDASGWQASLASSIVPGFSQDTAMNFGIETISRLSDANSLNRSALHFWYDVCILAGGVGWMFPRGLAGSIGVASYRGARPLRSTLAHFAQQLTASVDGAHGTYFPHKLREPVAGEVFVVGDAAGMCIALTGKGIRPALFFGEACGRIIRGALDEDLMLQEGLAQYAAFVKARARFFRAFSAAQSVLTRLPPVWVDAVARVVQLDGVRRWVFDKYSDLTREWNYV